MPPYGYTTVTLSEETAGKLGELVVNHELKSMADAIDYAADITASLKLSLMPN